jgi:hypothetical protein
LDQIGDVALSTFEISSIQPAKMKRHAMALPTTNPREKARRIPGKPVQESSRLIESRGIAEQNALRRVDIVAKGRARIRAEHVNLVT